MKSSDRAVECVPWCRGQDRVLRATARDPTLKAVGCLKVEWPVIISYLAFLVLVAEVPQ